MFLKSQIAGFKISFSIWLIIFNTSKLFWFKNFFYNTIFIVCMFFFKSSSLAYTTNVTPINSIQTEANSTNLGWILVVTLMAVVIVICAFFNIFQFYRNKRKDVFPMMFFLWLKLTNSWLCERRKLIIWKSTVYK